MDHADAEVSTDGGASWQKIPASVEFAVTPVGLTSGAAFGACNAGLSSGSYVFRAHGFRRPNDRGDLFSEPFPYGANLNC
jgi:hypothetical protein